MSEMLDSFQVLGTPDKGRVCVATRAFKPGNVLFEDSTFVHASELPQRCLACCETHGVVACRRVSEVGDPLFCPPELLRELDAVADEMCDLDGFNTLDRARCFIQCMLLRRNDEHALDPLQDLTAVNLPRCLESVVEVRARLPDLFPEGFSDDEAARVLGALNTNSHELEQVEGSGLFLLACIMEHDCNPNCSFTTFGDTIWLTAVRTIVQGDRLSIDYGNNFYLPTAERRVELEDVYGFVCNCRGCTVLPDRCRAFRCPSYDCLNGKVCPHGDGGGEEEEKASHESSPPKNWGCLDCGHQCSPSDIGVLLKAEETLVQRLEMAEESELGVEQIDEMVAESGAIHPTHFAVFWALEATAKRLSGESAAVAAAATMGGRGKGKGKGRGGRALRVALEAEEAWSRVVAAVEETLPALHHEKVVYLDALAQAKVMAGDIQGARESYKSAYRVSAMVSGANTPPTLDLKSLSENPPTTADELRARYDAV